MKNFLRKQWSNLLLGVFLLLMLIPQTRMPVQSTIQRWISFSPSAEPENEQYQITDYNWQLNSEQNKTVDFNRSEGRVVLVNFWATWCPPCVAEMPSMTRLYEEYGTKMDFYFVSDENFETVQKFRSKYGFDLPYYRPFTQHRDLNATSLPTTFLLDKTGRIVIKKTGAADWDSSKTKKIIDELLLQEP